MSWCSNIKWFSGFTDLDGLQCFRAFRINYLGLFKVLPLVWVAWICCEDLALVDRHQNIMEIE
jgi:hypothetical protein